MLMTHREQSRAQELDQLEEERKRLGEENLYADIDKFEIVRSSPSVVYLESGTAYLQGCEITVE